MKKKISQKESLGKLIKQNLGFIKLDVGCGSNKQNDFIGLDIRDLPNVDIVHDCESVPYPLPDKSCQTILASHLMEHLKPWLVVSIMNEWWRLLKVGGQLWLSMPYAGSFGFYQDPTHIKTWNEATPQYFCPDKFLYSIYRPLPWKSIKVVYLENGNLEIILEKISQAEGITIENNSRKQFNLKPVEVA